MCLFLSECFKWSGKACIITHQSKYINANFIFSLLLGCCLMPASIRFNQTAHKQYRRWQFISVKLTNTQRSHENKSHGALSTLGHLHALPQWLCKGEQVKCKTTLKQNASFVSTYGNRWMRDGATCQGFYLLMFYISIANLKRSDICVWEGRGRGGWGCLGKRLPSDLFFERRREWGKDIPCVLVNPS